MRKTLTYSLLTLSALALAACGKSNSGADGTSAAQGANIDPAKAAAQMAFQFQPGMYRTAINIDKIDIPGMPPAALEQMKGMMGKATKVEHCVSPDQAAKGLEVMKEHMGKGKCQFEKFEANGGTVDSIMVCDGGQGAKIRTASHGTYTPTGSVVKGVGDMTGPGGKSMHIEETVTMERIGDCTK